jgi:hypothetical protein
MGCSVARDPERHAVMYRNQRELAVVVERQQAVGERVAQLADRPEIAKPHILAAQMGEEVLQQRLVIVMYRP